MVAALDIAPTVMLCSVRRRAQTAAAAPTAASEPCGCNTRLGNVNARATRATVS